MFPKKSKIILDEKLSEDNKEEIDLSDSNIDNFFEKLLTTKKQQDTDLTINIDESIQPTIATNTTTSTVGQIKLNSSNSITTKSSIYNNCSSTYSNYSLSGMWYNNNSYSNYDKQVIRGGIVICKELSKEKYGKVELDNLGIYSDIEDGTNFLILAKALKDLLIKNNIITEEQYEEMYNNIKNEREDRINANEIADKLEQQDKITFESFGKYFN